MSETAHVDPSVTPTEPSLYERAKGRLDDRRGLQAHALAFVLVNAFLVVLWALDGRGAFWPVFPIAGWGIGLAFHAWSLASPAPSQEKIRAEMERLSGR